MTCAKVDPAVEAIASPERSQMSGTGAVPLLPIRASNDVRWKFRSIRIIQVSADGRETTKPNNYFHERSTEECPGCHCRKLLRLTCGEAANEAGGAACWFSSQNTGTDNQSPRPRSFRILQLFRRETRAGAGRS